MVLASPTNNKEGQIRLELVFLNVRNVLITYHVDKLSALIESVSAADKFLNRGGFIYPLQPTTFRTSRITVPLKQPLSGTLEYVISYSVEGSSTVHHTSKSLKFDCWLPNDISGQTRVEWMTTYENED